MAKQPITIIEHPMPPHQHTCHRGHTYKYLLIAVLVTFSFASIEAIYGWHANSLALLSDAGHMVADSSTLMLAAFAAWIAAKPPTKKHSYGYGRAEVLAAWVSSMLVILLVIYIIVEAFRRLHQQQHINSNVVILVAGIGLWVNLAVAFILHRAEKTINTRAAMLHVMGDLLGSLAALASGLVIRYTGWLLIDPILSIFIGCLISISAIRLLRESMAILMDSVPGHIHLPAVKESMLNITGVLAIHDLHIWVLASGEVSLSAHVELEHFEHWQMQLANLEKMLADTYHITHTTIQPECSDQSHL
tara:strand:+ start:2125 stop:3036 length:912 start_codon:yes stop_codon:yes gene_type:complete